MKKKPPRDDTPGAGAGERLRNARQRLGLTQSNAARRAGIHRPDWTAIERGKPATLDHLDRLARAIGADPHEIDPRLCPTERNQ